MAKKRSAVALACLLLLTATHEAWAHKMMAAALPRDDGTVLLQAFFPDGKPARGVKVEVFRPDGSVLLTAQTDDAGKLTVTPDAAGQWKATFTGSMGHKTRAEFCVGAAQEPASPAIPRPDATAAGPGHQESLIQKEPFPWVKVAAGLGFIFGLSALLMCLKLRASLKKLASG